MAADLAVVAVVPLLAVEGVTVVRLDVALRVSAAAMVTSGVPET